MILLQRLTPFVLAAALIAGMYFILFPHAHPIGIACAMSFVSFFLFARLMRFEVRTFAFWNFVMTPVLFLIACLSMIFFLENVVVIYGVAVTAICLLVLYAEYLFQYIHLPLAYQPYSLEYLSLLSHLLTVFFLACVGFGSILLLQTPLVLVSIPAFFMFAFVIYGTFWVSKAHESKIKPYTYGGAALLTELFLALSYLPAGFYTLAALFTILFYLFIGLTRAHVLRTLSPAVTKRYLALSACLLIATILSSQWL